MKVSEHTDVVETDTEYTEERGAWDSNLQIVSSVKVVVPVKLFSVMHSLAQDEDIDDNEFSIITWIDQEKSDGYRLVLKKDYYIPKQKVTTVSIDYGTDEKNGDVVIHRHPNGAHFWSDTDKEYINQNYKVSLLFTRAAGFIKGIYNLSLNEDVRFQIPVDIEVDYGIKVPEKKNIEVEEKEENIPENKFFRPKIFQTDEEYLANKNKIFPSEKEYDETNHEVGLEDFADVDMGPFRRHSTPFQSSSWEKDVITRSLKEGD